LVVASGRTAPAGLALFFRTGRVFLEFPHVGEAGRETVQQLAVDFEILAMAAASIRSVEPLRDKSPEHSKRPNLGYRSHRHDCSADLAGVDDAPAGCAILAMPVD